MSGPSSFIPMIVQSYPSNPPQRGFVPENEPPARVMVAIKYLWDLSLKTMTRVAVNDISIEEIAGQTLIPEEKSTQIAACELLMGYFDGSLRPDQWEAERSHAATKAVDSTKLNGCLIRCVACGGGPSQGNCMMCRGMGSLMCYPTSGGE